jgi:hypothetical protein
MGSKPNRMLVLIKLLIAYKAIFWFVQNKPKTHAIFPSHIKVLLYDMVSKTHLSQFDYHFTSRSIILLFN